jgi:hypothetical protein
VGRGLAKPAAQGAQFGMCRARAEEADNAEHPAADHEQAEEYDG